MDRSDLCIHPYRKRKFFYGLAALFDEPPPTIQSLKDRFPNAAAEATDDELCLESTLESNATGLPAGPPVSHSDHTTASSIVDKTLSPSQEPEEDSFEYVDFDKSRASLESAASVRMLPSQSSLHESMQDSLLFLPHDANALASISLSASQVRDQSHDAHHSSQPTILSLGAAERMTELADYYDLDRYCEAVPCWAFENQSSCTLHTEAIRRPMLLFCLQALDELIASSLSAQRHGSVVECCRLARIVFASMWEQDVRGLGRGGDIVISDYLSGKNSLPGVALTVWKVVDSCWAKHKQNFFHDQELYFVETGAAHTSVPIERWRRRRQLLQVYSLKPSQAKHLDMEPLLDQRALSDQQIERMTRGSGSVDAVQFGLQYLQQVQKKQAGAVSASWSRDLLSQSEFKLAFQAIELHLRRWSSDVQIFPCGSFPRSAAFGSVIDVLVGLPEHESEDGAPPVISVLDALSSSSIVSRDSIHQLSPNRALAVVPYKTALVILDVKVYRRPCSWFALLYYTGPESFTRAYFTKLLKRSLNELSVVNFDHIYECVVDQLGLEAIAAIDSEKHLFDLVDSEYILPPQRM